MKNIMRIAWREFTAIASTKAFWIGMAMSPLIGLGFSMVARTVEKTQPTRNFIVIDETGHFGEALTTAVELNYLRALIPTLRTHYQQYREPNIDLNTNQ